MKGFQLVLEFYKSTLLINISIAALSLLFNFNISSFCFVFCTFGFLTVVLYKEYYSKNIFYFYYNNNLSKKYLYSVSFVFNILL
ncbi:hypothetical protein BOW55_21020, partial [Flavobacterium sp. YO12]